MALTIKDQGYWGAPIFECDWCHHQIEDVAHGNVYWLHDEPSRLYFNHKRCAWQHEKHALRDLARVGDALVLSEHLEVFLAQLLGNSGRRGAMPIVDTERLWETRGSG